MTQAELRARLVDEFSEAFAFSYFDLSEFSGGSHPILRPWSYIADGKFRQEARRFLEREGVKLGPPICNHLKPAQARAA